MGGFKSGCTSNLIPAGGILNAPDYTRTCTCSYQNQTSLALVHDPQAEMWTFNAWKWSGRRVRRLGINLGAPGDRLSESGTLWLDWPSVGGPSPDVPVRVAPAGAKYFRSHASQITSGPLPWIACSGARGLRRLEITLEQEKAGVAGDAAKPYTVRLILAEPDSRVGPGSRVFSVRVQDKVVLSDFDIVKAAGGPNRAIVREFRNIPAARSLTIELTPTAGEAVLCGVELIAE